MTLTQEQKDRIEQNRLRALEIQRKRKLEEKQAAKEDEEKKEDGSRNIKRPKEEEEDTKEESSSKTNEANKKLNGEQKQNDEQEQELELEAFEVGASEYITKQEAMKVYCLPEGTLQVCRVIEKPNPHNTKFAKMKLYERAQCRQYAHKRYGGIVGLQKERQQRQEKRLTKDLQRTKDIFR